LRLKWYDQKLNILAVYPLPKRTNKRKRLFISISCVISIICVHIIKYRYIYKLVLCWKCHLIPTRNSQDMDQWTICLQFWGHERLGDSACNCACAKKLKKVYGTSSFKLNFSILSYISEDLLLFLLQVFHKVTNKKCL